MSSEAITRNDLKAVLDEVLPVEPSEFKKLLWTNPNPTSAFGAQTITLDLSDYDAIELVVRHWSNNDNEMTFLCENGKYSVAQSLSSASSSYGSYRRGFNVTNSGVTFNSGLNNGTTENNSTIPIRIYGIKYERIAPPQVDASDYVVEQGANYRKWNSGAMEQWGEEASASASAHAVTFPVPFASSNYVVLGTNTSGTQSNFMTSHTSASYFYVYPVSSTRLLWIAIGKWK